jgi:hypothetical protein
MSSGAGTTGQLVTDVPCGLSLTPPQETKPAKVDRELAILSSWNTVLKHLCMI